MTWRDTCKYEAQQSELRESNNNIGGVNYLQVGVG